MNDKLLEQTNKLIRMQLNYIGRNLRCKQLFKRDYAKYTSNYTRLIFDYCL